MSDVRSQIDPERAPIAPVETSQDRLQSYLGRPLTRRSVLQFMGLSAGAAFLAACGSSAASSAPSGVASAPASAPASGGTSAAPSAGTGGGTPAKGGEIKFACNFEPDSLDPHVASGSSSFIVLMNAIDTLVLLSPDDKTFHPYLADSWTISPDGKVYTFKLHPGVKFHDGTPFNAAAVKFNFDRIVDPATKSAYSLGLMGPYDKTVVLDDLTAEVHMKTAYPPLLDSLSQTGCGFISPAAPAKYGADISKNPIGTGFMKFVSYTPKDNIQFTRNPDYNWAPSIWGHQGPAYLDTYTCVVADDPAARVTALESGDATAIEDTPGQDVDRLSKDPKYQLIKGFIPGAPRTFFLNIEKAPLDDVNVRKAINFGIDHDELTKLATVGTQPGAHGPFSPATPGHSDEADNIFKYDPAMAAKILDDAGWKAGADGIRAKNGQKLHLTANARAVFGQLFTTLQSLLQKIGVEVEIITLDTNASLDAANKGQHHIVMTGVVASDPSNIALLYHSRNYGGYDWSRIKDAAFDKMWDDAAAEVDRDKRLAMYGDIQKLIMNNAWILPGQVIVRNNFYSAKIKGVKPDARGIYLWLYDAYVES
jgi:peptide/nickel transport system substrate-binding protein